MKICYFISFHKIDRGSIKRKVLQKYLTFVVIRFYIQWIAEHFSLYNVFEKLKNKKYILEVE